MRQLLRQGKRRMAPLQGLLGITQMPQGMSRKAQAKDSEVHTEKADVVAVLTGNVLKDPDYIYRYHTGQLEAPGGVRIEPTFGNRPVVVPNDADKIAALLEL